jgi:hypothetical protein
MIIHWLWVICNSMSEGDAATTDPEQVTCDECLRALQYTRQFMYEESDE